MKTGKICIAFFAVMLAAFTVSAKTMYVNDLVKLMVRSSPGLENRIVAIIESGDAVEMLDEGDQWSRVRTQGGKEGWVLTRYLTENETASRKLARLEEAQESVSYENETLKDENRILKSENEGLSESLEKRNAAYAEVKAAYEALRKESADFLRLKQDFANASAQLAELEEQNRRFRAALEQLERNQNIRWFVAGASVLVVGYLIGLISRKKRRKPSLI